MSKGSYMPDKQAEQVLWSQTFATVVAANIEGYGVSSEAMTNFVALNSALQAAWTAAANPATRSKAKTIAKNLALANMKIAARGLVSIIQGTASVTDQMKATAGVTVRKTTPTSKPVPATAPYVTVTAVEGRVVKFELRQDKTKRGKPVAVSSATVFTATGPTPPSDMGGWRYQMISTLTTGQIDFGASETGDRVHITAFWTNAKGESGPAAVPASLNLPAAGALPSAKGEATMRIARAA